MVIANQSGASFASFQTWGGNVGQRAEASPTKHRFPTSNLGLRQLAAAADAHDWRFFDIDHALGNLT
jgi:hypothetical protein